VFSARLRLQRCTLPRTIGQRFWHFHLFLWLESWLIINKRLKSWQFGTQFWDTVYKWMLQED
ncbi:hypothetical protein ACJX0J_011991, partial [Zea mays]